MEFLALLGSFRLYVAHPANSVDARKYAPRDRKDYLPSYDTEKHLAHVTVLSVDEARRLRDFISLTLEEMGL